MAAATSNANSCLLKCGSSKAAPDQATTASGKVAAKHLGYEGDVGLLCRDLAQRIASKQQLSEPIHIHVRSTIATGPPDSTGHLRAFRRLVRVCPYAVLCTVHGPSVSAIDLVVALSCDSVDFKHSRLEIHGEGEDLEMARRHFQVFTGSAAPQEAGIEWSVAGFGGVEAFFGPWASAVPAMLPYVWMGLRHAGMVRLTHSDGTTNSKPTCEQQRAMEDCYASCKSSALFAAFDALTGRALVTGIDDGSDLDEAVRTAIGVERAAADAASITLTSDIMFVSVAEIQQRLSCVLGDASVTRVHVRLLDGEVGTSRSIFPRGAATHSDIFKWHRKWEQVMASLRGRDFTCAVEGIDICPPLMELFFAAKVRQWKSPLKTVCWCEAPFWYSPGPEAMKGSLNRLPVATLRRFLLTGLPMRELEAWGVLEDHSGLMSDLTHQMGSEGQHLSSGHCEDRESQMPYTTSPQTLPEMLNSSPSTGATAAKVGECGWEYGGGLLDLPEQQHRPQARQGSCSLLGYGLATPGEEHKWSQTKVADMLKIPEDHPHRSLFKATHIENRYLAELERDLEDPASVTLTRLREKHLHWARTMLSDAILNACADANIEPKQLGHISVCSTSGYLLPGLTAYVAKDPRLSISPEIQRQDIVGMGCHAGLNSFKSAAAWAVANPGKYAIACGVEVMSAQYVWGETSRKSLNNVICNSLFGDGCFAAVLYSAPPEQQEPPKAYLDAPPSWWSQFVDTGALDDMIYHVEESENKYRFDLSELAPYHVAQGLMAMMRAALYESIPVHCIDHVVMHTGGRTVLNCSMPGLGLEGDPQKKVPHTVSALRDFGNQSSSSFMFAFDKLVRTGTVRVGDNGLFVTMGPGAGLEMAMWTAGERFGDAVGVEAAAGA